MLHENCSCGNTHMTSHLFQSSISPHSSPSSSVRQSTHRPKQALLNRHSTFSSLFSLTANSSLVSDPCTCTKSDRNYFSSTHQSNASSLSLSNFSISSKILKPSTASHHSKALSSFLYLCLWLPITNLPEHLNGTCKTALFDHAHNSSTSQWQTRLDSRGPE